jgi:hypothetical protein
VLRPLGVAARGPGNPPEREKVALEDDVGGFAFLGNQKYRSHGNGNPQKRSTSGVKGLLGLWESVVDRTSRRGCICR